MPRLFAAELDRPQPRIALIAAQRDEHGVEPIWTVLKQAGVSIGPHSYYAAKARPAQHVRGDGQLKSGIARMYAADFGVYGAEGWPA